MADYSKEEIKRIEQKWRSEWQKRDVYKVSNQSDKPKYYVLDMFPYPSGAGLHVGHPLGYIASDILARFKRIKGFNVLHPMGFDAFGLPAEQYALEHGIHPAVSTADNINNFKRQLGSIGFSYDWGREVQTCDPKYYKWTQWIFLQIFDSWYNRAKEKAERISELIKIFETEGSVSHPIQNSKFKIQNFSAADWKSFSEKTQQEILMQYRLAYLAYTDVNWCEALGTVLANDEVINGVSYRGGFPVVKKQMRQWSLRITEYAERLLKGLDEIDFSESMKEIQRNWIGKSVGARVDFHLTPGPSPEERGGSPIGIRALNPGTASNEKANTQISSGERDGSPNEVYAQDFIFTSESKTWKAIKENVRENRKNPTIAEEKIWQAVRNSKLGHKFRRQHSIDKNIVDFVCIEAKLVVEIDGPIHEHQKEEDAERTEFIQQEGFKVIRFSNEEVLGSLPEVLKKIKAELTSHSTLHGGQSLEARPLSSGEGRGEVSREGLSEAFSLSSGEGRGEVSREGLSEAVSLSSGEGRGEALTVFTTRPDTIFGVDFMVLAPEHDLVKQITTAAQKEEVEKYLKYVESRSEVDRMAEAKKITGAFTGAYAVNPFNGKQIPIWISEYVLAGYGTGAIMAVPCGDERDHKFAKHFNLPITNIIGSHYNGEEANPTKDAILENSGFLNGMVMRDAMSVAIQKLDEKGIGTRQINYKMRDAGWSRQRYWGEPFPVVFRDDVPYAMKESELPLELPPSNNFKPSGNGEGPLANLTEWINFSPNLKHDSNTMPTHAGAAWYFLRYMDPNNPTAFADKKALDYWGQVDVYVGGSEHAVAHLLYSRLWTKVLHDLGYLNFDEPFKKLINQGKITGDSRFVYRLNYTYQEMDEKNIPQIFVSKDRLNQLTQSRSDTGVAEKIYSDVRNILKQKLGFTGNENFRYEVDQSYTNHGLHVDISIVNGLELDTEAFKKWKPDFANAEFILEEDGKYICGSAIEKMSKSYFNVVSPDAIIDNYGADALRMYEMFLGPIEQSKPWSTQGIDGVFKFLRKVWNLCHDAAGNFKISEAEPTREELKVLHKTIKKIEQDIENFSFNTSVSEFMICVNELGSLKCNKRAIIEPLVIALSPFAPHIVEELWEKLGHAETILKASFPKFDEQYLTESSFDYPISINGKVRLQMNFALDMPKEDIEKAVLASEAVIKWTEGKPPKKMIVVQGRIVNVVL